MAFLDDPRVFFAAERTLLAWNRSCLALMAFGFVIERFGLFVRLVADVPRDAQAEALTTALGVTLILAGSGLSLLSAWQYRGLLAALGQSEIPRGYRPGLAIALNVGVALLGLLIAAYLVLR